jgi:hypothetical protein
MIDIFLLHAPMRTWKKIEYSSIIFKALSAGGALRMDFQNASFDCFCKKLPRKFEF